MTARSAVDREVGQGRRPLGGAGASSSLWRVLSRRAWPRRSVTSTTSQPARPAGCCVAVARQLPLTCPWGRLREDWAESMHLGMLSGNQPRRVLPQASSHAMDEPKPVL